MLFTRRFILAAAALGASFSSRLASASSATRHCGVAGMRLRALLPVPASARQVGRMYLERHPEEDDNATLTRLIVSSMSEQPAHVAVLEQHTLAAMVNSRVRADFEKGITVEVGGWILSRTEARLCALWT
jgi:hypothetical protein